MFTGIVECQGEVVKIEREKSNLILEVRSEIFEELKIDQSVAHNGVCLTVVALGDGLHRVVAIKETLEKSNLNDLKIKDSVNLERCMKADGRFDGHIVQGHVDTVGKCVNIEDMDGSYQLTFKYEDSEFVTVEKGSICVNGISLTVINSKPNEFSVAIIPYTWEHTNFRHLKLDSKVNIEFDIVGKYIQKLAKSNNN